MSIFDMNPRDKVMVPAEGWPGAFIRGSVADEHPGRIFGFADGHLVHFASDLAADGWQRDGDQWVKP